MPMLLIPCPWCGPRAQIEFSYGGAANAKRPATDAPVEAWFEFVYLRENAAGPHDELWLHAAVVGSGCVCAEIRERMPSSRAEPPRTGGAR